MKMMNFINNDIYHDDSHLKSITLSQGLVQIYYDNFQRLKIMITNQWLDWGIRFQSPHENPIISDLANETH